MRHVRAVPLTYLTLASTPFRKIVIVSPDAAESTNSLIRSGLSMALAVIPYPDIDPVALQIGPLAIRWYALAYIGGLGAGGFYAWLLLRNEALWGHARHPRPQSIGDLVLYAALGVVIGGRLGDVLFYEPGYYFAHPLEIVQLWNGGMAFHGGLIGAALAIWYFARETKTPVLTVADICAAAAPIGIFLVRIANFINEELWGRPSDVAWAMIFPDVDNQPRHPSQLYEAGLEGLLLFIVLALCVRGGALKRPGLVSGIFCAGYGAARIVSEFFREPDPQLEQLSHGLTMGMALSAPVVLAGAALIVYALHVGAGDGKLEKSA
jgi:phosphatidylglycerol---prolipoprotein diacylglyceryl transferase